MLNENADKKKKPGQLMAGFRNSVSVVVVGFTVTLTALQRTERKEKKTQKVYLILIKMKSKSVQKEFKSLKKHMHTLRLWLFVCVCSIYIEHSCFHSALLEYICFYNAQCVYPLRHHNPYVRLRLKSTSVKVMMGCSWHAWRLFHATLIYKPEQPGSSLCRS